MLPVACIANTADRTSLEASPLPSKARRADHGCRPRRLGRSAGRLDTNELRAVDEALGLILDLQSGHAYDSVWLREVRSRSGSVAGVRTLRVRRRVPHRHAWELVEATRVGGDDDPVGCERRRSDQQVVGSARSSESSHVREQRCVCPRDDDVVALDRHCLEQRLYELLPAFPPARSSELDADKQLGRGDSRDHYIVFVSNDPVKIRASPLSSHQDRCVENQSVQDLSSTRTLARNSASSPAHARSGRCSRSSAFTRAPEATGAGAIVATVRPRLTTRNVSPRFSTASSTSENRRAASVALTFFMKSDYQISSQRRDGS